MSGVPPYSTDSASADRLVEEMVRRGFHVTTHASRGRHNCGLIESRNVSIWDKRLSPKHGPIHSVEERHHASEWVPTRPDAVSAAALLALRSAS